MMRLHVDNADNDNVYRDVLFQVGMRRTVERFVHWDRQLIGFVETMVAACGIL